VFKTAFTGAASDISSFFLNTVKHFMVVVLHLGFWFTNEKHNTQRTF